MNEEKGGSEASAPAPPEPVFVVSLRWVDRVVGWAEAGVVVFFLVSLICIGAYQAVSRNFFRSNPEWVDPLIRSSVFLIGMVGAALSAQADRLINIDMLTRLLSARGRVIARVFTALFAVGICWYYIKSGLIVHGTMVGERDPNLLKAHWVAMALPICAGLMAFHLLLHTVIDVFYLATRRTPPASENEGLRL